MNYVWLPPWPGEAEDGPEWVPDLATHPMYLAAHDALNTFMPVYETKRQADRRVALIRTADAICRKHGIALARLAASPARLPGDHTGA